MIKLRHGVFGSTIVATLVDYASTIRKKNQDRDELFVLTHHMKTTYKDLLTLRSIIGDQCSDEFKDTDYISWFLFHYQHSFNFGNKKVKLSELSDYIFRIMRKEAILLHERGSILASNQYLPISFVSNIDELIEHLDYVLDKSFNIERSEDSENLRFIFLLIKPLFPECWSAFSDKWDTEEMKKQYGTEEDIAVRILIRRNHIKID